MVIHFKCLSVITTGEDFLLAKYALGVGQLQEHCPCRDRAGWRCRQDGGRQGTPGQPVHTILPHPTRRARGASPVTWMYWGLFSAGKLKADAEYLS